MWCPHDIQGMDKMQKVINSGYSHRSLPAQELLSRAVPSVGGSITAQLVQPQGEIPEEGRKKNECIVLEKSNTFVVQNQFFICSFQNNIKLKIKVLANLITRHILIYDL